MTDDTPPIEYVEARRVLLDALKAIRPHLDALVLVGAQAVYLRTQDQLTSYQAFTTDADVVVDPDKLRSTPPLGQEMEDAGFTLTPEPGIWEARFHRVGVDDEIVVPVDLIVPEQLAPSAGRRSARLPGEHGKATARKIAGLEGAVVDNAPVEITSLETTDRRQLTINVAGPGALLVAKAYKIGERTSTPRRLKAKDAGDVYRIFAAATPKSIANTLVTLLNDQRSARVTTQAIEYIERLFATPSSTGTELAVEALRGTVAEATVIAVVTRYTRELIEPLGNEVD